MDRANFGYRLNRKRLRKVFGFFSEILCLNGGDFEGVPFDLRMWQAFIVGSLFGWTDSDDMRRFRVAFIESGKGSGKSPLAAGIGHYMLIADGELRAEIYAAASKKDQAMVLFRDAVAMVDLSPELKALVRRIGGDAPWNLTYNSSFFRAIASDEGQSGPRPHGALIDEIHEHRDDTMIEMMRAGFKGRRQPLLFMITNSGSDVQSVCFRYHDYAIRVAHGQIEDHRFFGYVCALDEKDEPFTDESCWVKTNPNLGASIQLEYLRDQVREALAMPAKESRVRRLHFCQWTDAADPWIARETWRACEEDRPGEAFPDLAGEAPAWLAIDLSMTTDLAAVAAVAKIGEDGDGKPIFIACAEFWTPADTLEERGRRDQVPYDVWVRQGFLHAVPGKILDYGPIAERLGELAAALPDLRAVVFDRYRIPYLQSELDDRGISLPMIEHPQGFAKPADSLLWMPQSITELEGLLLNKRLRIQRNPVLTWNAASAVMERDRQDNRIFAKRKSRARIDGVVALAMAIGAAMVELDASQEDPIITFV